MGRRTNVVRYVASPFQSKDQLTVHAALRAPYIFAFNPSFVEIRHVTTGALVQTIHGAHMRCLTLPSELRGTASIGDTAPPPYSADAVDALDDPLLINSNDDMMLLQRIHA